jgi:hypothetical protein
MGPSMHSLDSVTPNISSHELSDLILFVYGYMTSHFLIWKEPF